MLKPELLGTYYEYSSIAIDDVKVRTRQHIKEVTRYLSSRNVDATCLPYQQELVDILNDIVWVSESLSSLCKRYSILSKMVCEATVNENVYNSLVDVAAMRERKFDEAYGRPLDKYIATFTEDNDD